MDDDSQLWFPTAAMESNCDPREMCPEALKTSHGCFNPAVDWFPLKCSIKTVSAAQSRISIKICWCENKLWSSLLKAELWADFNCIKLNAKIFPKLPLNGGLQRLQWPLFPGRNDFCAHSSDDFSTVTNGASFAVKENRKLNILRGRLNLSTVCLCRLNHPPH